MKRLLCIVSSMDTGGAETFLMKLYRTFDINNYQMDFCVSSENQGYYDEEIQKRGGKIFRITRKTKNFFKYAYELRSVIKSNQYVYVMRIGADCFTSLDLWIAYFAGAKVRVLRSSNAGTVNSKLLNVLHRILRKPLTSIANVKIAPSDLAAEFTFGKERIKKNRVIFFNNGLDVDLFKYSMSKRDSIRKEFNIKQDDLLIGHIGRFNIQKNHDFLIDIFVQLLKIKTNSKLILVGKGELEQEIREKVKKYNIEQNVIFTGIRSDIPDILSAIDVFVFPSYFEGMPNTVIEAQAAGLPCIISDSITKEANITGLVDYLPISDIRPWVDRICGIKVDREIDVKSTFEKKGYDINSLSKQFIHIVFKDKE